MHEPKLLTGSSLARWLLAGCVCGLAANLLYIAVSVALDASSPPVRALYPLAWLFGPLVLATAPALAVYLAPGAPSVTVDLARRLMIAAAVLVTLAIILRGVAEDRIWPVRPESAEFAARFLDDPVQSGLVMVQRSVELAWELCIYLSVVLFGTAMLRQGRARAVVGALGILVAATGLVVNAVAWPADPDAEGLVAMGPFVGFWFMTLSVMMGWRYRQLTRDVE